MNINTSLPQTIPVVDAIKRAKDWRATYPGLPKAFAFDFNEMKTLINTMHDPKTGNTPSAVRFYLGINSTGSPCLMIVGVVGEFDPALNAAGRDQLQTDDTVPESLVFDFSNPCPYLCDTKSALYDDSNPPVGI